MEGATWRFERRLFQAKEKSWFVQGTVKSRCGWSEWERKKERRSGRERGRNWESPGAPRRPF